MSPNEVYFGGPDLARGRLRDVLAERVAAVPAGGEIDWITYYFRDRPLAEALLQARRRGVNVTVTLEGRPRTPDANDDVVAMLAGPCGLGEGFRTISLPSVPTPLGKLWKPQLHEKLYCFSHPKPVAFIGSFNPSGDDPEEKPRLIREIGDQDRGHNVLVGLDEPKIVDGLVAHSRWMHRARHGVFYRFLVEANHGVRGGDTRIYFWPRLCPNPVTRFLGQVASGARIRIAASHIKGEPPVKALMRLAHRAASLDVLAESTLRRVPMEVERKLKRAGIRFCRVAHPEGLPMHNKFVLVERGNKRWVIFGSFNWTTRSYWFNYEIVAISDNKRLYDTFAERWDVLRAQNGRQESR